MTGRILVGSCSWADKTLVDSGWYPPKAKKPEERLRFDGGGRLGRVFSRYPPWFGPRSDNREMILDAKERLGQYEMAVEFRNAMWMAEERDREQTLKFLADNAITYVCIDEPQGFKSSVPPTTAVTAATAVVRMHGHNAEMWTQRVKT